VIQLKNGMYHKCNTEKYLYHICITKSWAIYCVIQTYYSLYFSFTNGLEVLYHKCDTRKTVCNTSVIHTTKIETYQNPCTARSHACVR